MGIGPQRDRETERGVVQEGPIILQSQTYAYPFGSILQIDRPKTGHHTNSLSVRCKRLHQASVQLRNMFLLQHMRRRVAYGCSERWPERGLLLSGTPIEIDSIPTSSYSYSGRHYICSPNVLILNTVIRLFY